MPYDIELLDKHGKRYAVAEHRYSYRWEVDHLFDGEPNRISESVVQFSNVRGVWRFECINPIHSKKDYRIIAWPIADAAYDIDDYDFEGEEADVPQMLRQWAQDHPEGVWRVL